MTPEEIKQAYLEWIEDYSNNKFDKDNLPGGVKLALDNLVKIDPLRLNILSEKIADLSQTYTNDGNIPQFIYNWIKPYKRVKSI